MDINHKNTIPKCWVYGRLVFVQVMRQKHQAWNTLMGSTSLPCLIAMVACFEGGKNMGHLEEMIRNCCFFQRPEKMETEASPRNSG